MKDKKEQGQMNDLGDFLYAPVSAFTLVPVPLTLSFVTLCDRDIHRRQVILLIVMEVFAVSVTSWF